MELNSIVVYGNDGDVDISATETKIDETLAALKTSLLNDVATFAADSVAIADAVSAVFDEYKGARLNMPAVASFALKNLGDLVTPKNHAELTARTLDYIRANSGEGKLYVSAKGPKGGCARVSDLPVATNETK